MVRAQAKQPASSAFQKENSDEYCDNLDINMVGCQFDMCYNGVVIADKVRVI